MKSADELTGMASLNDEIIVDAVVGERTGQRLCPDADCTAQYKAGNRMHE